jgi:L,D-transpeptidase ErfK/SrfK
MLAVMPNTSTTSALALASSLLLFPTHALSESFSLPPAGTDLVGEVQAIVTQRGDTLLDIARRFGLGYGEITAANPGIDPWVPDEGTRVILPTQFVLPPGPRSGIVLNLPQLRLFYFPPPQRGKPAQVLTYLRLLNLRQGLLINFNVPCLKDGLMSILNSRYKAIDVNK